MSKPKVLHSPMTNRWYVGLSFRKDGSVQKKVDITDLLDAILAPQAKTIEDIKDICRLVVNGYSYGSGDYDLDDNQPIHVSMSLGTYRLIRRMVGYR